MQPEQQIKLLEARVQKLENILYGISNDLRSNSVMRGAVIIGEHTDGKPTIVSKGGKKYKLQTV